jgi:hypothetical protein
LIAASVALAVVAPLSPVWVDAFPLQRPSASASTSPAATPTPPPNVLPFGSMLAFVLDGTISSGTSRAGEIVKAHLERDLVLDGQTVAHAGAPVEIKIVDASPASNPDIYGYVDIYFRPLDLPDGRAIPLRAPAQHLNVNVSAGHESTAEVENTIGDIFQPTLLYHVFRKGRNFTLQPGARINALTEATVRVLQGGTVAITTPAPIVLDDDAPVSSYRSVPMATPNPSYKPALTAPPGPTAPGSIPTGPPGQPSAPVPHAT